MSPTTQPGSRRPRAISSTSRTHDLVALLTLAVKRYPRLMAIEADCRNLSAYGSHERYPSYLGDPEESDARRMVDAAKRVRVAVFDELSN